MFTENIARYKLFTDSGADLPEELVKMYDIEILPLSYTIDGTNYSSNNKNGLSLPEFYKGMREGKSTTTSQISGEDARYAFEKYLQQGQDILFIGFSSALSGSFGRVSVVAAELNETYPQRKILLCDSLCASLGEGLLVVLAAERMSNGENIDNLFGWLESVKMNIVHIFTVNDLNYLHKGGRVSKATAIAGSLLGIKPILHVNNEGKLVPVAKVRGRKQSLMQMAAIMEKLVAIGSEDRTIVAISHGDCREDAEILLEELKKRGILDRERVIINYVGPVIGSHSGPGTVALFFLGKER